MKIWFDTSVLVAALLKEHPAHAAAFPRVKAIYQGYAQGFTNGRTLAELFETLTSLPLDPKISPRDAQRLIRAIILNCFEIVPESPEVISRAMRMAAQRGMDGTAIRDALCIVAAHKAECEKLLTFNLENFRSLAPEDPMVACP
ncbi:PIN domain-containing protein [Haloferula sp. BvORR071]|uniref:type II toxin-antitoxin system VapC family toxin n=1 Tax=Haloferula sp. BvORR071 TaxID=1396141 RepID=UPI00094644C5|nr:PIN domain-containing protein [Haloferula sp. BvORR071]